MPVQKNGTSHAHTHTAILHEPVDKDRIKDAVREIISAIGEDPEREGLLETPRRIADMYEEIFAGLRTDPFQFLAVTFDEAYSEMVVLKDIPFYSMCEHHFAPFHGVAHVAYIPKGRVVGLSKLARVVEAYARRPQVQERLTAQIADTIMEGLDPKGAAIVIEAEHTCLTMRGIKKPGAKMVTSAVRGLFKENPPTRAEFQSILRGDHFGGMGGLMAEPDADLIPVALAIGGNLGDRATMLREAVRRLVAGGVLVDGVSSLYETPPWGYAEQPKFLNGAIQGRTALPPHALLTLAKQIERDMGRVETFRNAPRPVDIDIALYGNQVIDEADLQVPHPGLPERAFVLVPLAEIAGSWVHPPSGKTIAELRAALGPADEIAHFLAPARWAYITPEMEPQQAAPEIAIDSSTHPRYPARVLALHRNGEILQEVRRLGMYGRVADAFPGHVGFAIVQIDGISRAAAEILTQMNDRAAAVLASSAEPATALATGPPLGLLNLVRHLEESSNADVCEAGVALRLALQRRSEAPAIVKAGRHTFDWMNRVQVMGILNATPDSFSDAGRYFQFDDAVRRAYEMAEQGATMIEVGGQSAQPGMLISVEEELRRIVPLLERLDKEIGLPLAVDTFRFAVARGAVAAGAIYINDISGGEDEGMARLAAETGVLLGIMHIRGKPKEKQWDTTYESVMDEVTGFLHERIGRVVRAGVQREKIVLDPGLGFGKEAPQDLEVMHRFSELRSFGLPILLATSRKNYLSDTMGLGVRDLVPETAAAVAYGIAQGASIIRVHDVDVMARIARFMPYLLRHSAG